MLGGHSMPLTRGSTGFAGQQLCLHQLPARQSLHTGRPGRLVVQARTVEPTVGMWGTKQGMDQYFTPEGECYAATIINFAPGNIVTQVPAGLYSSSMDLVQRLAYVGSLLFRSKLPRGMGTQLCKWGTGSQRRRTSPRTSARSPGDEPTSPSQKQDTARRLEHP